MAFSILSLDGGGTWALVQARVLQKLHPGIKGHDLIRKFDLVIANSGGSLVLAMLLANKTVDEIVNTFNDVNVLKAIFKKKFISHIPLLKDFMPNYEAENKYEVFRKHLINRDSQGNVVAYGDKYLHELPALIGKNINNEYVQIVITNFDYDRERAVYWRSNMLSKMESSYIEDQVNPGSASDSFKTVTLAQAIHGASNAPVQFFDDPAAFKIRKIMQNGSVRDVNRRLFWDGAVGGNNNPVKAGVLEALANSTNKDQRRKEITIRSIGTSATVVPVLYGDAGECQPEYNWMARVSVIDDWKDDLKRMANSIIADPPDASSFDAHQILDLPYQQNDARFVRINPMVKPILKKDPGGSREGWYMPGIGWDPRDMKTLFTMDMAVATEEGVKLINKLCDDFFADAFDNQGIRIGGDKMEAILGHKNFSEAKKHW